MVPKASWDPLGPRLETSNQYLGATPKILLIIIACVCGTRELHTSKGIVRNSPEWIVRYLKNFEHPPRCKKKNWNYNSLNFENYQN